MSLVDQALADVVAEVEAAQEVEAAAAEGREAQLSLRQRYALDPLAPLRDGAIRVIDVETKQPVPFDPFDHQIEVVETWVDLDKLRATGAPGWRNFHSEKSSQMGESWIVCYIIWWAVTFHIVQGIVTHLIAADVDDGGPQNTWRSLFGKVRFIQSHLPLDFPAAPLVFRALSATTPARITNLDRPASFVIGRGAGGEGGPGRGGTWSFGLVDEAAFLPNGEDVHAAISPRCEGEGLISTPHGTSNVHYRIGAERPAGWRFLRHHWSSHPVYRRGLHVAGERPTECEQCAATLAGAPGGHRYPGKLTSSWYEAQIADKTDVQVAQELDIDHEGSLEGRVYAEWQSERHVTKQPIGFDERLPLELGWDYGMAHLTAIVICQDHPAEYRVIGAYETSGMTPDQVAAGLLQQLRRLGVPERLLEQQWTRRIYSVGDPAGESRSLATGTTLVADYAQQGFSIQSTPRPISTTVNAVKRLLRGRPKPLLVSPAAEAFIQHIRSNRWPTNRQGVVVPGASAPLDDEHNHMMRAFAYLIAAKFPLQSDTLVRTERTGRDAGVLNPGVRYGMGL